MTLPVREAGLLRPSATYVSPYSLIVNPAVDRSRSMAETNMLPQALAEPSMGRARPPTQPRGL